VAVWAGAVRKKMRLKKKHRLGRSGLGQEGRRVEVALEKPLGRAPSLGYLEVVRKGRRETEPVKRIG